MWLLYYVQYVQDGSREHTTSPVIQTALLSFEFSKSSSDHCPCQNTLVIVCDDYRYLKVPTVKQVHFKTKALKHRRNTVDMR